ncbi:MAG: FoF1 ATP synthase subunit B' [Campylobacterota bacterium]|nr:FoF1 ATP synthase subunit B' [Campylobacterota bacterium]
MLDIHVSLMLVVFAIFLFLLVVLNQMLYKPLIKFMDDRDSSIAKDLEAAKRLAGNSEELYAEADGILDDARSKAAGIRQKAVDEAKVLAESKAESKRSELDHEYASFLEKLDGEKEALKNSLLSQVPLFKESLKTKISKL